MALLTVQNITRAGIAKVPVPAAAGGDTFTPGKFTFLYVLNQSGGSHTVTAVTPNTVIPDVGLADSAVSVPGGGSERLLGPFPPEHFADTTDGLVHLTYSGVTSLSVTPVNLSQP